MSTPFVTFCGQLATLSVTGVSRTYAYPPPQVSTADMPLLYVRLPQGDAPIISLTGRTGLYTLRCDVVVVMEPLPQNLTTTNYTATLTMMDALVTALDTHRAGASANDWGILSYTIRGEWNTIGESSYWTVIAEIEALAAP